MNASRLTTFIVCSLVAGSVVGYACHSLLPAQSARIAELLALLPFAFLRLVMMIVAPLVFCTLVVGIARLGDPQAIGRVGGKALACFLLGSVLSLALGLVLADVLEPGKTMSLSARPASEDAHLAAESLTLRGFVSHAIPTSVIDAMAHNEILQIVVFSIFFGTALVTMRERAGVVTGMLDAAAHVLLKMTGHIMQLAPLAVFGAIAGKVATDGIGIIRAYGAFMAEFYLGIVLLCVVLIVLGSLVLRSRIWHLLRRIRVPTLLAFSTTSSEAAYPKTLEELERFGISARVASFVLPLGYSFNLVGSMMYCAFAVTFLAQIHGVALSGTRQIATLATLMLMSKGMAGVPRGALVVVAATLPQLHIPEEGLLLLIGVDHFLDMGRSAINVMGNSIAAAVVSRWEGEPDLR
jgi:Na+/H+-dicarboxylate symporter